MHVFWVKEKHLFTVKEVESDSHNSNDHWVMVYTAPDTHMVGPRMETIIKLRESGMTYRAIGDQFNLSGERVAYLIQKYVKRFKPTWVDPKQKPYLRENT